MADFEPPSFSLGLDSNLFDSEPQITPTPQQAPPPSSNQSSVAFTTFNDELQTLVVDDSEPELTDSLPKLKRLRRGLTVAATSSSSVSAKAKAELTSTAVVDDEDKRTVFIVDNLIPDQHLHTQHHVVCASSNSPQNRPVKRKQHLLSDQESDSTSCNGSDSNSNLGKYDDYLPQHVKRKQNVSYALNDFPKAYRYFFHDDMRIQELVRSRLPYFSPLGNMIDRVLEQPSTSKIDYMGQFSFAESSRQAARTNRNKKSSSSRKISSKSETEETSQGWVNPKLGVDKVTKKRDLKRKARTASQTAGHWVTVDGKKVYVGKSGQELTGRGAYMQYKKESGLGFKKIKWKSVTKKKK